MIFLLLNVSAYISDAAYFRGGAQWILAALSVPVECLALLSLERRYLKSKSGWPAVKSDPAVMQAAEMAHEIKNVLTVLQTFAEYLPLKYDDPEFRENFSRILADETRRARNLTKNFLQSSALPEPRRRECDLAVLVKDTAFLLEPEMARSDVRFEMAGQEVRVLADADQVKQALLNLFMNAIDAMRPHGGRLRVILEKTRAGGVVRIEDSGPGIPPENLSRLFEPFFTGKKGGTGLGLSVTRHIFKKNAGKIRVESRPGRGTQFLLSLPLVETRFAAASVFLRRS